MRKKIIVHVVNSQIYSGLEKVACEIISGLSNNYRFIYVTKNGPIVNFLKKNNIEYYIIEKMSVRELIKMIKTIQPDLIHAHDYRASCFCSLVSGKIPLISHLHANPIWIKKINLMSLFYLLASHKFDKVLTVSDSIKDEYLFSKSINNKINCISNPFSKSEIIELSNKTNCEDYYDICCVGRLEEPKDPFLYCNIIRKIKEVNPEIKAVWIGSGLYMEEIINYSKKINIMENVNFIGYMENPFGLIKNSKIFVLPTKWEGFGLSVVEALSLGLPCVVSNVGGLKKIVDNSCGKLCDNEEDFVNEIKCLLDNKEKYLSKCENAAEKSNEFDNYNEYMEYINSLYKELIKK